MDRCGSSSVNNLRLYLYLRGNNSLKKKSGLSVCSTWKLLHPFRQMGQLRDNFRSFCSRKNRWTIAVYAFESGARRRRSFLPHRVASFVVVATRFCNRRWSIIASCGRYAAVMKLQRAPFWHEIRGCLTFFSFRCSALVVHLPGFSSTFVLDRLVYYFLEKKKKKKKRKGNGRKDEFLRRSRERSFVVRISLMFVKLYFCPKKFHNDLKCFGVSWFLTLSSLRHLANYRLGLLHVRQGQLYQCCCIFKCFERIEQFHLELHLVIGKINWN